MIPRSGSGGLPHFMRRLLTGYAVRFNKRHTRAGHLFQNRYRSEGTSPSMAGHGRRISLRDIAVIMRALKVGSRAVPIPRIRSEIACALTKELGLSCVEIARQLGVSHVAVSKMIRKEDRSWVSYESYQRP